MLRVDGVTLPLDHGERALERAVRSRLGLDRDAALAIHVFKRTADARGRQVRLVYAVDVELDPIVEQSLLERSLDRVRPTPDMDYRVPTPRRRDAPRPVVIGMGPCGLFAALVLAEAGMCPVLLERGKKVRERTVDTFGFWRKRRLDPESNVQFGEGGAGTFSDGKLYSQVRDRRFLGRKVLREFVEAGAPEEILWQGRPHIGTFKLVKMVESMRAKIESLGGEIRFETRVTDLWLDGEDRSVRGVRLASGEEVRTDRVILAVGHSARDTFAVLRDRGVAIERKPFSIGVRIEHPQSLIDRCRYGRSAGHPRLGAADYRLSHPCQGPGLEGRTVYSFCMCPGGTVVAAASEVGGVVTNGMSQYDRSERNANAGMVVDLSPEDFDRPELRPSGSPANPKDVLAGVDLQRRLERAAFQAAGASYDAPGQLVGDLLQGRGSTTLGSVTPSYTPGVTLTHLAEVVPEWMTAALCEAIPAFDRKIPGFALEDAVLTGVETRTSSPIRICRDRELQSPNTPGLFPAGEGAGFAGGILSAAIDGIRVAEALAGS